MRDPLAKNDVLGRESRPCFSLQVRANGKVGDENAVGTGIGGAHERVLSGGEQRIQVAEQDDGNAKLRGGDEVEHSVERDAMQLHCR